MGQSLQGQVALVTGGGRGIGRGIAESLAAEGASVAVVARTQAQLDETVAAIAKAGGRALGLICDVTQRADVERVVKETEAKFGPITFLVNNAGQGGPVGPIGDVDPDEWWQAQAVHVRGPLLFMSAVIPGMKARKRGRILNIVSISGTLKFPGLTAYSVGKATAIALTERVDLECKEFGVRVFAAQPGTINTEMGKNTLADPAVKKYTPWLIDALGGVTEEKSASDMAQCQRYAAQIAAGQYDALAGRYIDFGADLDRFVKQLAAAGAPVDQATLERNKQTVLAFYEAAINQKDFDVAVKYMSPHYKQHNPTAKTGPEGLREWLKEFKRLFPNLRADVRRVIAEGDLVALHVHGTGGRDPNGVAVVDIFRVENNVVMEHWDVIQPIPLDALNPNSMF